MFLTADDLKSLTGYVRPTAQVRWLCRNGIRFTVNGLGETVVAAAEVERKLISGSTNGRQEPHFGAINGTPWTARQALAAASIPGPGHLLVPAKMRKSR